MPAIRNTDTALRSGRISKPSATGQRITRTHAKANALAATQATVPRAPAPRGRATAAQAALEAHPTSTPGAGTSAHPLEQASTNTNKRAAAAKKATAAKKTAAARSDQQTAGASNEENAAANEEEADESSDVQEQDDDSGDSSLHIGDNPGTSHRSDQPIEEMLNVMDIMISLAHSAESRGVSIGVSRLQSLARCQLTENRLRLEAQKTAEAGPSTVPNDPAITLSSEAIRSRDRREIRERVRAINKLRKDNWHAWRIDLQQALIPFEKAYALIFAEEDPQQVDPRLDLELATDLLEACEMNTKNIRNVRYLLDDFAWDSGRMLYVHLQKALTKMDKQSKSALTKMDNQSKSKIWAKFDRCVMEGRNVETLINQLEVLSSEADALGAYIPDEYKTLILKRNTFEDQIYRHAWDRLGADSKDNDWELALQALGSAWNNANFGTYSRRRKEAGLAAATTIQPSGSATSQPSGSARPPTQAVTRGTSTPPATGANAEALAAIQHEFYWRGKAGANGSPAVCYNCLQPGHISKVCKEPPRPRPTGNTGNAAAVKRE